jgi:hypothetical protein
MNPVDDQRTLTDRGPSGEAGFVPTMLGPYRLVRYLGAGGMGVVYEAVDEERRTRVAVKTLSAMTPGALLRFKQEYRSLADITHVNLVTLYELMAIDNTWFFTMELVDGVSFLEHVWGASTAPAHGLTAEAEIRLRQALRQLAVGVEALHAARLLHLDLKPANTLVEPSGRVVILDFGLVQPIERDRGRDQDPESELDVAGTPLYVSPELVLGMRPGPASDWYAVGIMLFEALTGVPPFTGKPIAVIMARTAGPVPDADTQRAGLPPDLTALCRALMAQDPASRAGARDILAVCAGARSSIRSSATHKIHAPLVGREAELTALHQLCDGGLINEPLCVFIDGASGVGKTALAGALLARLESERDAIVLRGRCYERESMPFKGFDAIVDALCQRLNAMPRRLQRELVDDGIHYTARIFSVLRDLEILASIREPAAENLDPQALRLRAFAGLARVLRRLSDRHPVVVFLDDLHWADADSAHLLRELLAPPEPPRLLVIGVYRDDEAQYSAFLHELRTHRSARPGEVTTRTFTLGPLASHDAEQLARACLGPACAADRVSSVARDAGGIPFLIEAVARHSARAPGEVDAAPAVSLDRLIELQLDDMPSAARRMLQVVAVAARPIEQSLALAAAHPAGSDGGSERDDHAMLARLRSARLVRTRGVRGTDLVETYHDRVRQTITGSMAPPALAEVHGQLATVLEADRKTAADTLAYHLHGAGELRRAAHYAKQAAHEAVAALAFERAAERFADALRWDTAMPDEARKLQIARAQALVNAGRCGDAAKVYLEAAVGAPAVERRELRGRAAEAFLYGGHLEDGLEVARELLAEVGIRYPGSQRRALLGMFAWLGYLRVRGVDFQPRAPEEMATEAAGEELFRVDLCWSLGKGLGHVVPLEGAYFMVQALVRALRLGEPTRIGRGLAFVGGTMLSQWRIGKDYIERSERLGRNDPYLAGLPLIMRGLTHIVHTARWKTALDLAQRGTEILRTTSTGISWELALATSVALKALEAMGDIAEIGRRAAAWRRESEERGDKFAQVMAGQYEALSLIGRGETANARDQDRRLLAMWASDEFTAQHFYSLILRIYCELHDGRHDAAWKVFHRELPRLERAYYERFPISRVPIYFLRACLQIARARQRPDERDALLRQTARLAARLGKEERVDGPVHARLIEAGIAAARGERSRAIAALRDCRDGYRRIDMQLMAACVERRLGELSGDREVVAAADAACRRLGVAEPARWADAYVPRFVG